jgi:membrane protein DedA with SNARE-associated domain
MLDSLAHLSGQGAWACPAIVLIMALESTPLIGFFLPGSATLIALGSLSGAGLGGFLDLLACAAAGSLLGDSIGYWSGRAGRAAWRARSGNSDSERRAEALIRRHGRLGVFVGRFVWLAHVAVPPAAGIAGISPRDFYLLNIPAATMWCALHLAVGHWLTTAWISGEGVAMLGAAAALLIAAVGLGRWLCRRD